MESWSGGPWPPPNIHPFAAELNNEQCAWPWIGGWLRQSSALASAPYPHLSTGYWMVKRYLTPPTYKILSPVSFETQPTTIHHRPTTFLARSRNLLVVCELFFSSIFVASPRSSRFLDHYHFSYQPFTIPPLLFYHILCNPAETPTELGAKAAILALYKLHTDAYFSPQTHSCPPAPVTSVWR